MTISSLKRIKNLQIFTIFLRYLIGAAFVFASIVKIHGMRFTSDSGADSPINSAWHFFETMYASGLYWKFLGWGQLIAGFVLMTQRWSTIGAILFLPIIANVFVITISYEFAGTPVITFLMLLANIYLLIWDWNKLKLLFSNHNFDYRDDNPPFSKLNTWAFLGLFYFLLILFMRIGFEYLGKTGGFNPFYFLLISFGLAVLIGLILIVFELRRTKTYQ
ncbi:hypothetical protein EGI22_16945 [Lacihabitans sp. LS3-19]|uniref:hypothetical protein n=1 Tax=Lacihabitans sp. LS3-19 TaxID=2487335 RepID=UPI0020CF5BDE|nr:hypothetical protein [Lacihabitans sp. LS3-19]MCP9769592.1 hypothetical protein [Lacihabitans sp. LS3-19]